jgi:hypothetical protein
VPRLSYLTCGSPNLLQVPIMVSFSFGKYLLLQKETKSCVSYHVNGSQIILDQIVLVIWCIIADAHRTNCLPWIRSIEPVAILQLNVLPPEPRLFPVHFHFHR